MIFSSGAAQIPEKHALLLHCSPTCPQLGAGGGGGGFEAVFPELSHVLAVNRAKELLETDAEIIVTHCPGCIMQLTGGLKELKVNNVEVLDLAQVVATALEE